MCAGEQKAAHRVETVTVAVAQLVIQIGDRRQASLRSSDFAERYRAVESDHRVGL